MNTLRRFSGGQYSIPGGTSWYLADLGEFRGKQELYTRQSPQRLKSLREHALIEIAVSSNPLERELIIPFGGSGYVALFEIIGVDEVVVSALRHQREDDYY